MAETVTLLALVWFMIFMASTSIKEGELYKLGEAALQLTEECEAKLPRDQTCILIAVPEEDENE